MKIKLGHQRRPRGLRVLVDRVERAERSKEDMRRALAEAEREGVGLRAEKDRARENLEAVIGKYERGAAEEELAVFDLRTSTDKLLELHAETLASMDRTEQAVTEFERLATELERDLNEYIEKEAK